MPNARDRVVRFAKAAHDMGIAERHVELEQAKAEQVVGAVRVMLDELGLVPVERERALRAFLGALGGQTVAGEVSGVAGGARVGDEREGSE